MKPALFSEDEEKPKGLFAVTANYEGQDVWFARVGNGRVGAWRKEVVPKVRHPFVFDMDEAMGVQSSAIVQLSNDGHLANFAPILIEPAPDWLIALREESQP